MYHNIIPDLTTVTNCDHSGHNHCPKYPSLEGANIIFPQQQTPLYLSILPPSIPLVMSTPSPNYNPAPAYFITHNDNSFQDLLNPVNEIVISTSPAPLVVDGHELENNTVVSDDDDDDSDQPNNNVSLHSVTENDLLDNSHGLLMPPPSTSPTSSFVLEEEIVPFFDAGMNDIFIDLNLPTIYGNQSTMDHSSANFLTESENKPGPSFGTSMASFPFLSLQNNNDTRDVGLGTAEIVTLSNRRPVPMETQNQSSSFGNIPVHKHHCQPTQVFNGNFGNGCTPGFIQNQKTRDSVFHTLLETIVDRVEQIEQKTEATVKFYLIFGSTEINEENVHTYLNRQQTKVSENGDGINSKYPTLFNNMKQTLLDTPVLSASTSGKPATFDSTRSSIVNNATNQSTFDRNMEMDESTSWEDEEDDYDPLFSTVEESESESPLFNGDHLYAATLLRQKVSSPTIHDHQYNEVLPRSSKTKSRNLFMSGLVAGKSNDISSNHSTSGTKCDLKKSHRYPNTFFKTDYQRHRCLRHLVQALFLKIQDLEDKTGALVMDVAVTYEGQIITRHNYKDVINKLIGFRSSSLLSFESKFDDLATQEQSQKNYRYSSHDAKPSLRKGSNFSKKSPNRPTKASTGNDRRFTVANYPQSKAHVQIVTTNNTSLTTKTTTTGGQAIVVRVISSPKPVLETNSIKGPDNAQKVDDQNEMGTNEDMSVNTFARTSTCNPEVSPRVYKIPTPTQITNSVTLFTDNCNRSSSQPICAKCSSSVPIIESNLVNSSTQPQWMWLRCYNPLCFYMIHSTCLGFFVNCGSIDLNQFTFPPFYCEEHRLK